MTSNEEQQESNPPPDATAPAAVKEPRKKQARELIKDRREMALDKTGCGSKIWRKGAWHSLDGEEYRKAWIDDEDLAGIAFSGGGIRSATIALGLTEALVSRGRFYGFDLMSTVSGGGYFGSFLRGLFVPRENDLPPDDPNVVVTDRAAFGDATLKSLPDQQYFRGAKGAAIGPGFVAEDKAIKNPLWWLRENGRYLAPGGMSDYGFALSYIVRNWVSLLIFVLAAMMVAFAAMQLVLLGLHSAITWAWPEPARTLDDVYRDWNLYSPITGLVVLVMLTGTGIAAGYWLSLPAPFLRPQKDAKTKALQGGVILAVLLVGALFGFALFLDLADFPQDDPTAQGWAFGLWVVSGSMLVSTSITWLRCRRHGKESRTPANSSDFRREQTRQLAGFNLILLTLLGVAAIDNLALWLRATDEDLATLLKAGGISVSSSSILAFLIAKLPGWLGGEDSGLFKLLAVHARKAALVAALIILASMALFADLLVLKLLWKGAAWQVDSKTEWLLFGPVIGMLVLLTILFGRSVNFVNLLALTPFYSSRLTRAYLGGGNVGRLDIDVRSEVTRGFIGDDLVLKEYMEHVCPAPFHLINVTRNRTVGDRIDREAIDVEHDDPLVREDKSDPRGRLASYESSLTLHDRHGDRMVYGPFGVRVGADFFDWDDMAEDKPPPLGLLCAISGAAVGSGMGRHTSLGTAMALTLANVRLGYWAKALERRPQVPAGPVSAQTFVRPAAPANPKAQAAKSEPVKLLESTTSASRGGSPLLPGLSCLRDELLGKFDTTNHWFLSDGGHSENSGALALLERGCRLILVADNAQDPSYAFSDLEIFIRTARTDIGMEVGVADPKDFPDSLKCAKDCFFNGDESAKGDWRERVKKQDDAAFALLLVAYDIPLWIKQDWKWRTEKKDEKTWIVWLKPNRFANLPADLATYAELHPDFPQQSTANQFFDEAQWESYRRLGFEMGKRLFGEIKTLSEFLPVIHRS